MSTKKKIKADSISQGETDDDIPVYEGDELNDAQLQQLIDSFRFVMKSRREIYVKLTWISCAVIMIASGDTRKNVTQYMEDVFSTFTLSQMYTVTERASQKIVWLSMEPQDWLRLELELSEHHTNGKPFAQCVYSDFYMNKGGKASISNWISNINKALTKEGLLWNI